MKYESVQNLFVFLGCVGMLFFSGWFVWDIESERHMISKFHEVTGNVVRCEDQTHVSHRHGNRRESHSYRCVYHYEVSGRSYTAEQIVSADEIPSSTVIPCDGGAITVYYKPSNPQVSRVFVREFPKVAMIVVWLCIVGVWFTCPFKFKIPMLFFGDAEASTRHPWIAFFVYILALALLSKLLILSGCSGFGSRVDPETGDVWGP